MTRMPPSMLDTIAANLTTQEWTFAKTMPQNPHWYCLRERWANDATFDATVTCMRKYGYREIFARRPYTMLNLNGMKYWTMGAPLPATILINRRWIEGVHEYGVEEPYDAIAPMYDTLFQDTASRAENAQVMDLVGDLSQANVLDIGCGTGLLLDYLHPAHYVGIDPSLAMLDQLRAKHPQREALACSLEEYSAPGMHDVVVCLFGSANYIDRAYVEAIPRLLRPGGRYVVMFYKLGYEPVTYQRSQHYVAHAEGVHATLPGEQFALGNFIVVRGRV